MSDQPVVKEAAAAPRVEEVLAEIERHLNWLQRVSYSVDVRAKYQRNSPVIAVVVDHNNAMHALLFIRKSIRDLASSLSTEAAQLRQVLERVVNCGLTEMCPDCERLVDAALAERTP